MRLISLKKQGGPALLESAPGSTRGGLFFGCRPNPGVKALQACPMADSRAIRPFRILGILQGIRGVIAMSERSRWVFLASLVPAALLGGVFAVGHAQNAGSAAATAAKPPEPP